MVSPTEIGPANVETPVTFRPVVLPTISIPPVMISTPALAVITPTESILVTSS